MKWMWLWLVFFAVFFVRLFFAFQVPFFSSDVAYLQARVVDHLVSSPSPLFFDSLGWGGRYLMANVFHYVLAFFSLFLPEFFVFKVVPNLLASLIVFPVFLIVYRITKRFSVSLFCALLSAFVPVFFIHTFNHLSVMSLVVPLFFFLIYAWLRIPSKFWVVFYVFGIVFFSFLHPFSIVFVLGLTLYVVLMKIEGLRVSVAELELLLFSLAFIFWSQFLIYKNFILFHGFKVIWQNIPFELLSEHFFRLPVWGVVLEVGLFPLIFGIFIFYKRVFRTKKGFFYLFFGFACLITFLLWLRLIELFYGLMLIGIILVVLFGSWLVLFESYLKKTRVAGLRNILTLLLLFFVLFSSFVPVVVGVEKELRETISSDVFDAFLWLKNNSSPDSVVLAPVHFGHYITALSNRTNVIDSVFLLQAHGNERFKDVRRVFSSVLETEVVDILDKYDVDYVIVPKEQNAVVFSNNACFDLVFDKSVRVFRKSPGCRLKVV